MNKEKFIGIWTLKSFETRFSDGSIEYPMGKNLIGYIMYHPNDYMSVVIMNKDRANFNEKFNPIKDFCKTINSQKKSDAFDTYFSYCGPYEIKNDQLIVHHLDACSIPDWVGISQDRTYKFSANTLTLSNVSTNATALLVWERIHD